MLLADISVICSSDLWSVRIQGLRRATTLLFQKIKKNNNCGVPKDSEHRKDNIRNCPLDYLWQYGEGKIHNWHLHLELT